MKVVMAQAPESLLDQRRRTGADRWDEIWNGVVHMPPMPNREHQDFEGAMETWLREFWAPVCGGKVYHQINVASPGGWPDKDYRIPDLVLLTPERFHIDKNEYFEGAPTVVVEIRSPHDETYEKFDFYARLGVAEVWVVNRDSREAEIHRLSDAGFTLLAPGDDGWLISPNTGVQLRGGRRLRLTIQLKDDESTRRSLPS